MTFNPAKDTWKELYQANSPFSALVPSCELWDLVLVGLEFPSATLEQWKSRWLQWIPGEEGTWRRTGTWNSQIENHPKICNKRDKTLLDDWILFVNDVAHGLEGSCLESVAWLSRIPMLSCKYIRMQMQLLIGSHGYL